MLKQKTFIFHDRDFKTYNKTKERTEFFADEINRKINSFLKDKKLVNISVAGGTVNNNPPSGFITYVVLYNETVEAKEIA